MTTSSIVYSKPDIYAPWQSLQMRNNTTKSHKPSFLQFMIRYRINSGRNETKEHREPGHTLDRMLFQNRSLIPLCIDDREIDPWERIEGSNPILIDNAEMVHNSYLL